MTENIAGLSPPLLLAKPHPAETACVEAEPSRPFTTASTEPWERFSRRLRPHLPRLQSVFRKQLTVSKLSRPADARHAKALNAITAGAAARMIAAGRPIADFFEQVAYNSRRLAKLNVPPAEVIDALAVYDSALEPVLDEPLLGVLQQLHFRTLLALNRAYYQVREAETQAFYGLVRAEAEATGLDDLLHRFILILTRTFRAQAGRMIPIGACPPLGAAMLTRLKRPRYIAAQSRDEDLILDREMRGLFQSYWSIPFFSAGSVAGLIQFGFATPYRWLPRELDLLNAFAERCLRGAERVRLMENLAAREEQVRSLAAHLLQAEEEERRRISRELHDEAGQSMLFLRLHLEMLEKSAPAALQGRLKEAREVTERIVSEIRRIIAALHPSAVEELGLQTAIRRLGARFRKLCPVQLRLKLSYAGGLPREAETTIYRVVQECFQNIARHSQASHVNLLMRSTDTLLELNVEDNGVGFEVDRAVSQPGSFGLLGMRERVALLGGKLEICSSPGQGARIAMRLPIGAR